MIGGVVVAWEFLRHPISEKLVTSQYVIQLVPYVKGQVENGVRHKSNQPIKRVTYCLEIEPAPYPKYTQSRI